MRIRVTKSCSAEFAHIFLIGVFLTNGRSFFPAAEESIKKKSGTKRKDFLP